MKPTKDELDKIRCEVILNGDFDKYVYLREDDKGKYIEYAFKEGVPHDNRCLSWYDSYQEKAYIRNGWVNGLSEEEKKAYLNKIKKKIDDKVGGLFILRPLTCGFEEKLEEKLKESEELWAKYYPDEPFIPEDHICKVGKPSLRCRNCQCKNWTYEEPVKCACWCLDEPHVPTKVLIPIELAMKLIKK